MRRELARVHAVLNVTLNEGQAITASFPDMVSILIRDPVIAFDDTKVTKTEVEEVMARYRFMERLLWR